jgi:hypothetical protein
MAVQALGDQHEHGHLVGDVPALLLVARVGIHAIGGEVAVFGIAHQ